MLATKTHPDTAPLGWEKFAELVATVQIPVYALGGMKIKHLLIAQQLGAYGIAAIRGLWG